MSFASFSDVPAPAFYEPSRSRPSTTHPVPLLQSELFPLRRDEKLLLQQEIGRRRILPSTRFSPLKQEPTHTVTEIITNPDPAVPRASDAIVAKPVGEAGRPGRGGYNLRVALKMDLKRYKKFTGLVQGQVKKILNTSQCFTAQSESAVKTVVDAVIAEYPDIRQYEDLWPITDIIRSYLKYSSRRGRLAPVSA